MQGTLHFRLIQLAGFAHVLKLPRLPELAAPLGVGEELEPPVPSSRAVGAYRPGHIRLINESLPPLTVSSP